MPTFENVEVEQTITLKADIDFEVYCDTCGKGLCNWSSTTVGRTRGVLQVRVEVCSDCIDKKEDEISALESQIEQLEDEIRKLATLQDKEEHH